MGLNAATLADHRVTSARVNIPARGRWYADASIDGEVTLTGAVTLVIADLTLKGTILSGGPSKGRSHYRIVAGAGGWAKILPRKSYVTDAGVKVATVLTDAAGSVGETLDAIASSERAGPHFVRTEGPAYLLLDQLKAGGWYVGEDGITHWGRRAASTLGAGVTHGPVDLSRGTVTLAAESIAGILPGLVVDGIEAIDVEHTISAEEGLRSTISGARGDRSAIDAALRRKFEQFDPDRKFRGFTEYRVSTMSGSRLNLQPVQVSTGMPDLGRVRMRPGVPGCYGTPALGSRVLVGFANADQGRPFVAAFEDAEQGGFQPTTLSLRAGGMAGNEHVATVEGTALLIYNTLVALMAAAGGGPLIAAVLQPLIGVAINVALAAQAVPAPPTQIAQNALATSLLASFATGTVPVNTSAFFTAAISAGATKTSNVSGQFPSVGSAAVKAG